MHCMPSGTSRTSHRRRIGTSGSAMIETFTKHLVDRYGDRRSLEVVFRSLERAQHRLLGRRSERTKPTSSSTTRRERHQTRESASSRRRPRHRASGLGGSFLAHCKEQNIPVDFVSTHVYGNDKAEDVFGTHEQSFTQPYGLPLRKEGPRSDRRLAVSENAADLERVQRRLQ